MLVFWGANGIGKSLWLAEDCRLFISGQHPDQTHEPPVEYGMFGETWHQLGSTIKYFWERVDRTWFRKALNFTGGQLKGQKYAVYDIIDGPGKGGTVHMGTFSAGARRLAGPRYHRIGTDEPMPTEIFGELWPRLLGRGGHMRIGFTPTLGTAHKLGHLWSLVDDPDKPWAGEIQVPLTLDAVTPRGMLIEQPWMTQEEIDIFEQGTPKPERLCRMGLSRHPILGDRYFESFGDHLLDEVTAHEIACSGANRMGIGIDHGSKPGAQRAVLVTVGIVGGQPYVWVLDEYKADGRTEIDDDAKGIRDMLRRWGQKLSDVDVWIGDRAHKGDKWGGYKSNRRLLTAFARLERKLAKALPKPLKRIRVPRKYHGSVWDGMEVLHRLMVGTTPRIKFHRESTEALQKDLQEWRGSYIDPHKDGIDALRYAVVDMTEARK